MNATKTDRPGIYIDGFFFPTSHIPELDDPIPTAEELANRPCVYIDGHFFPSSHIPEKMPETPAHRAAQARTIALLEEGLAHETTTGVFGDMHWYYDPEDKNLSRAPDVMVVRNLRYERASYEVLWQHQESEVPCFILEVVSHSTKLNDMLDKRELYHRLGVREYFLFDPKGWGINGCGMRAYRRGFFRTFGAGFVYHLQRALCVFLVWWLIHDRLRLAD